MAGAPCASSRPRRRDTSTSSCALPCSSTGLPSFSSACHDSHQDPHVCLWLVGMIGTLGAVGVLAVKDFFAWVSADGHRHASSAAPRTPALMLVKKPPQRPRLRGLFHAPASIQKQ